MIVTRIQLYCDGEHGIDIFFPEDGPMDGAILTAAELRREAKKAGWGRNKREQDLCPDCLAHEQIGRDPRQLRPKTIDHIKSGTAAIQ